MTHTDISIRGYVVGPIWWPTGAECFKDLHYSITREDGRYSEPQSLREHVLNATNDGDFQSCSIGCGELIVRRETVKEGRRLIRERIWPLSAFPSVADCLADPDWFPSYYDEN